MLVYVGKKVKILGVIDHNDSKTIPDTWRWAD